MKYNKLCEGDYSRCIKKGEVTTYDDHGPLIIKVEDPKDYCLKKLKNVWKV